MLQKATTPSVPFNPEIVLKNSEGWIDKARLSTVTNHATDDDILLVRTVTGKYGNGSGEPKPFSDSRVILLSKSEAQQVNQFLKSAPQFAEEWKGDYRNWLGEYPCCVPAAGESLLGWQIEAVSFSFSKAKKDTTPS
jgi:hypothetical protein